MTIQEAINMIRVRGEGLLRLGDRTASIEQWVEDGGFLENEMMSNDWEVVTPTKSESGVTLKLTTLKTAWNNSASQFRNVKNADSSPVFIVFLQQLKDQGVILEEEVVNE